HLRFRVVYNDHEIWFLIRRSRRLEKVMILFCELKGKALASLRFVFKGRLVQPTDTPNKVTSLAWILFPKKT
ncbi:hypothetical protein C8A03DRAFT_14042, partial [Achaetomium macrosporum]